MERTKLLELLNKAVKFTASRSNVKIKTTNTPKNYECYVESMFNFINHPELRHLSSTVKK